MHVGQRQMTILSSILRLLFGGACSIYKLNPFVLEISLLSQQVKGRHLVGASGIMLPRTLVKATNQEPFKLTEFIVDSNFDYKQFPEKSVGLHT